jgi:beta-N-acetylhexosaminidase
VPGLSTGPATLSPAVYREIRGPLGFTGVIMTDSLSAGAISGAHVSLAVATTTAIEAGADLVLFGIPATGSAVTLAHNLTTSVFNAVHAGQLARATLWAAAGRVLAMENVNLCAITPATATQR